MNTKADKFKTYMDRTDPKAFVADELNDDQMHTVIFRSALEVKGQRLPLLVLLDDSIYVIVRVAIASQVVNDQNRQAILKFVNDSNRQYKVFKFYTTEEGDLILDSCLPSPDDTFDPELADAVIREVIFPYLNENLTSILEKF